MRDFFQNKLNILLLFITITILTLLIVFGVNYFIDANKLKAIDFTDYTKDEVELWLNENDFDLANYSYTFEYNDQILENMVIYQSVKVGDNIDKINFIYSKGIENKTIELPDYRDINYEDYQKKLVELCFNNIALTFNINELPYGQIIEVNPIQALKEDLITINVSYGNNIENIEFEVIDLSKMSQQEISDWAKKYALEVKFETKIDNTKNEGTFISQNLKVGDKGIGGSKLIVTFSTKGEKSSTKKVTIPDDLCGISEEKFIVKLNNLGFNNLNKNKVEYYSEILDKGTIYSYDDGNFETTKTINYALCMGKYIFDSQNYNNLTQKEAQNIVNNQVDINAKVNGDYLTISFEKGEVDNNKSGKTYNCAINNNRITCKVYQGNNSSATKATIPDNLLGLSEKEFLNTLKELGFENTKKSSTTYFSTTIKTGCIYTYDDGTFSVDTVINYGLSSGAYVFAESDFVGQDKNNVANIINELNKRNANSGNLTYKLNKGEESDTKAGLVYKATISANTITCTYYATKAGTTMVTIPNFYNKKYSDAQAFATANNLNINSREEYSDTVSAGYIISTNPSSGESVSAGSNLNVVVSLGKKPVEETKAIILDLDTLSDWYSDKNGNYSQSATNINNYFSNLGFTNVKINYVTSKQSLAKIINITVNGSSYSEGDYPLSSAIVVEIVSANP